MIKRLTADLISQYPQYLNPLKEREVDLRGNKISVIENLGATGDQFDSLDLSDNEIQKLENFPLLRRLKMILLSNNRVARIAPGLGDVIPNLNTLILSNNKIESFTDLDNLSSLTKLKFISLLGNPVVQKPNYRLYIISKIPGIKVIDFKKVKSKEKFESYKAYGGGKRGLAEERAAKEEGKGKGKGKVTSKPKPTKTFVPGEAIVPMVPKQSNTHSVEVIKAAIAKAKTLEEVQVLERALQEGKLPEDMKKKKSVTIEDHEEEEEGDAMEQEQ